MEEFTIKNVFKYWFKLWYVTVVLLVVGIAFGIYSVVTSKQYYNTSITLLAHNQVNANVLDYGVVANSDLVLKGHSSDCNLHSSQTGETLQTIVSCTDAKKVKLEADSFLEKFGSAISQIYKDGNVEITILNAPGEGVAVVSKSQYISKMCIPIIAALLSSFAVAFVGLDYKISKNEKK